MPKVDPALLEHLRGQEWEVKMLDVPCSAPGKCAYGCCCACCFTYQQRQEILDITGEPYVCFGGICPCGPCASPQDKNCLGCEVCCCTGLAVSGNRFLIQTRFGRESDPCDDCIITCQACLQCFAEILKFTNAVDDESAEAVDTLADCLSCAVMSCMLAQQQVELEKIKKTGYAGVDPQIFELLPPHQQEMATCQKHTIDYGTGPQGQQKM